MLSATGFYPLITILILDFKTICQLDQQCFTLIPQTPSQRWRPHLHSHVYWSLLCWHCVLYGRSWGLDFRIRGKHFMKEGAEELSIMDWRWLADITTILSVVVSSSDMWLCSWYLHLVILRVLTMLHFIPHLDRERLYTSIPCDPEYISIGLLPIWD